MASQNCSKDVEAGKSDAFFTNKHSSAEGQLLEKPPDLHFVPIQESEEAKKKLRRLRKFLYTAVFVVLFLIAAFFVRQYLYERQRLQDLATYRSLVRGTNVAKPLTTSTTETTTIRHPVYAKRQQFRQKKQQTSTTFIGLTTKLKTRKMNCMELVADGNRIVTVTPGHALSHWQTLIKRGDSSLEATMFIKVADPGVYDVYGQVAFYRNNATTHLDFKIVRNHEVIAKAIADKCVHICTRYVSRLVSLRKGDYLSIQSSYSVKLWMRKKLTYFGIRQIA